MTEQLEPLPTPRHKRRTGLIVFGAVTLSIKADIEDGVRPGVTENGLLRPGTALRPNSASLKASHHGCVDLQEITRGAQGMLPVEGSPCGLYKRQIAP